MMTDQQKPETTPRRSGVKRPLRQRLRHWWLSSSLNAFWWRFKDGVYKFWHPRTPGGQRRVLLPVALWLYFTAPFKIAWRKVTRALAPSEEGRHQAAAPGKLARGPGTLRRVRLWWQESWLARAGFRMRDALEYIWFSPSGRGQYGPVRQSRAAAALKRLGRSVQDSWMAQQYARARFALYDWWHPLRGAGPTARRRSRWALFTSTVSTAISQSWFGRFTTGFSFHVREWWYPPVQGRDLRGTRYQYRRVSRPVMYYRRWRVWFRGTWLGREFGWLVDTFVGGIGTALRRLSEDLRSTQLGGFLSRRGAVVLALCLAAVVVSGVVWGFPAYNGYVERQYGMQARLFMDKGDARRASLRARQAITINPNNPHAVNVLAELADKAGYRDAVHWRARLAALTPTFTNRLALAKTALRLEEFPYPTAAKTLRELSPEATNSFEFHMTAASLAVKMGDLKEAGKLYTRALELAPEDPMAKMSLASLRLQSGDEKQASLGREALSALLNDKEAGALPLRSLVAEALARNDLPTAESLSSQLLTNAQAKFSDGIVHAAILRARQSPQFGPFIEDLQVRAARHPATVGELASWMNQNEMADKARTWLEQVVEKHPRQTLLRLALADCHVALGDWEGLEKRLEQDRWPGLEHMRFAMMALAVKKQGGESRSRLLWERALSLGSQSPGAINTLARVTTSWGWHAQAEQALWQAAQKFRSAPWPIESLRRLYTSRKDTAGLRRVYQEMLKRDPADPVAKNNFASLSLLMLRDTAEATRTARQLHDAYPTNAMFASTYAYALHLQGNTAQGLSVLSELSSAQRADPAVATYEGILLASAGNIEAAAPLLNLADEAFLLPEEAALVQSAKAKLAAK